MNVAFFAFALFLDSMPDEVIRLYRPVGQAEFDLIRASGFCKFPPRLPQQPFFYPVLSEGYATQIARDWNTKDESWVSPDTCCGSDFGPSSSTTTKCTPWAAMSIRSIGSLHKI